MQWGATSEPEQQGYSSYSGERGHIPVLQLLLRPTAGSSQPFQEDPHDCDEEEEGEEQMCEDRDFGW